LNSRPAGALNVRAIGAGGAAAGGTCPATCPGWPVVAGGCAGAAGACGAAWAPAASAHAPGIDNTTAVIATARLMRIRPPAKKKATSG
jgi:hypothetical protein